MSSSCLVKLLRRSTYDCLSALGPELGLKVLGRVYVEGLAYDTNRLKLSTCLGPSLELLVTKEYSCPLLPLAPSP